MKRTLSTITALAFVGLTSFSTAYAATDTYTFDPYHTYVLWHANHFGFSNPSGKWAAEGTLLFDKTKPENSKLNVTIQTATLSTGNKEFDEHLKEKLFFDVTQYPTATFVSNKIQMKGKNHAIVQGTLTLRGVSKPVTLDVTLNKEDINPITNKPTLGFSATANIKRSNFDMTALLPGVSDDVKLTIEAEAYKTNS